MRREHAFYSSWCKLFDFHLRRQNWTAAAFAFRANRSQQSIHSYLCGRARPPLDQVPIWAGMLGLKGEERERFISAAQEAHTPPQVWRRITDLERETKGQAPPRSKNEAEDSRVACWAIIDELVALLRETEAVFFTRTIPVDRIATSRALLVLGVRKAIEQYARAPVDP